MDDSKIIKLHSVKKAWITFSQFFIPIGYRSVTMQQTLLEHEEGSEVHVSVNLHKRELQKQPLAL